MMRPSREFDLSPQRLRHIRWIGGGSGAGKSTVAHLLAEKHGLRLYHGDDTQAAHTACSNATDHPMLHAFLAMTMDERWAKRTPEEMYHTFHGFHGEGFGLILEDLLDLPRRSLAEPTRSGGVADSYCRVEAYCSLPAWIVMEHSRANKRSGDGPG